MNRTFPQKKLIQMLSEKKEMAKCCLVQGSTVQREGTKTEHVCRSVKQVRGHLQKE